MCVCVCVCVCVHYRAHGVQSLLKWRPVKKTRALVKTEGVHSQHVYHYVYTRMLIPQSRYVTDVIFF